MDLKLLIKPTKAKILLFAILVIPAIFHAVAAYYVLYSLRTYGLDAFQTPTVDFITFFNFLDYSPPTLIYTYTILEYVLVPLSDIFFKNLYLRVAFNTMTEIIFYYLMSCLIIVLYHKFKKK